MATSNKLEFLPDGTEVRVIFTDGTKSPYYHSHIEALKAFEEMLAQKKITEEEYRDFIAKTGKAEYLNESVENDKGNGRAVTIIFIGRPGFASFEGGSSFNPFMSSLGVFGPIMLANYINLLNGFYGPGKVVEKAYFVMCASGANHGHVFTRHGDNEIVYTKEDGLKLVAKLKSERKINRGELTSLRKEISESPLPENEEARRPQTQK
jgi:hypothetical protein